MFTLAKPLADSCVELVDLPLCKVLLANNCHFPWLILVPKVPGITELFDLSDKQQQQLVREQSGVAKLMQQYFNADKMNIAALGNQVPQLHIHIIARYKNDAAWPGPIWGVLEEKHYSEEKITSLVTSLAQQINALEISMLD